ncbi:aminotransferase class I/II-fold pyridoxal phosphate-dependent enzyme [Brevibacterium sp. 50QC2O2]|uniref:aminotransferase class I/II-fold pyridoxal phosphate-dependent enzyme n=1 Tax=unclassified Brevibacterium TaxID=2614124 RepID=UPI00211CD5FA|nr:MULTISPECIES: aminotransferase class I/II-fold pyridoxal phosphate-dependent enzyme [unclassified Brevibacterium]MCQ9366822.1 aminotransferase class I/II-fold pyridoxal phosphate-dependent enzyme [Brevibacterium sp. 91QC2O2]MCQ9389174.1 aminotransferase class I/II-fold pyridoxal phosphate-dependent enzyme [Brevibacterium sp. 50QC2O2]
MSTQAEQETRLAQAREAYEEFAARGLNLDITRGKPAPAQLDLSADMLVNVTSADFHTADGTDARNYGGFDGLPELRSIFAELLQVPAPQLLAQGNSSLTLMQQALQFALLFGLPDSPAPWAGAKRSFLCPVPGYDRHFGLTESLGFDLIPIPCDDEGPDLAAVREHVADPSVKGIWLVPLYANPSGVSISTERTRDLMSLATAAPDFTVMWDNAYGIHHLGTEHDEPLDVLDIAARAGHPNRVLTFASTSKVTFAGAGVAFFGASPAIVDWFKSHAEPGSIGPDKINQLRHARFFKTADGVRAHMARHAAIAGPKFAAVDRALREGLGESSAAQWSVPRGGYFITLTVYPGTASQVVKLAAEAGVKLTPAGSTHPHGFDPEDRYIRIAPTMPTLAEVELAAQGLAACIEVAELEARIAQGA